MLTPEAMYARDTVIAMFTPTAAATDTPPSLVSAFGVLVEDPPSPEPPFFFDVLSPKLRCAFTCEVTPLVEPSPEPPLLVPSPGAPAAEAVASAALSDDCDEEIEIASAVIESSVHASTRWLAT